MENHSFGLEDYHPHQLAFCGFSGSGKTTLLCKLVADLKDQYQVGVAKHDGHRFEMDREGKDTDLLKKAGARVVNIANDSNCARLADASAAYLRPSLFRDCDVVLIEGHKGAHFPKVLLLDDGGKALEGFNTGKITAVLALVSREPLPARLLDDVDAQGELTGLGYGSFKGLPVFDRNDRDGIKAFALRELMPQPPKVSGLLLVGGRSVRMGRDKSQLQLHGCSQLEHSFELLSGVCEEVFVSGRHDQACERPFIADRLLDMGPVGGLLSAMEAQPERAWLAMAVDMPWMKVDVLRLLVDQRRPFATATAFRSPQSDLPEPLCAIYEPKAKAALYQFLGLGYRSPSKVLLHSNSHLIDCPFPQALGNANTPADVEAWADG
jgi:molybdopterin-guanine dinucleotide biosynthesis protein MobB